MALQAKYSNCPSLGYSVLSWVIRAAIPEGRHVLPDSDLEHAAEQLRVVGYNPADMNDQLLLENSFPLSSGS